MITLKNHYQFEGGPTNRIILGSRAPVLDSKITIDENPLTIPGTFTGSIGFFDYLIADTLLPVSREESGITKLRTLRIPFLGIEPAHQKQGHFSETMKVLEGIAQRKDCSALTIESIKNPFLFVWGNRHGYKPYWDYRSSLKYLRSQ